MTLPRELIRAIALAVENQGGDMDDVDDLVATWTRSAADSSGRVDRLRYETTHPPCTCADAGIPQDDRCERCCGLLSREPGEMRLRRPRTACRPPPQRAHARSVRVSATAGHGVGPMAVGRRCAIPVADIPLTTRQRLNVSGPFRGPLELILLSEGV